MKDGQAAIRVFVDPDARLDVVMAVAILWNLQHPVAIAHGIVIADDAILVDAEDVPQVTGEGHECRAPPRPVQWRSGRCGPARTRSSETGWPPPYA